MPANVTFKLNVEECVFETLLTNIPHLNTLKQYNIKGDGVPVPSPLNLGPVTTAEIILCDF